MANFAPWFRREDYDRIREIMDDGDKLPARFNEWEKLAKAQKTGLARRGVVIEPVVIDPEEFIAFCDAQKLPRGGEARSKFAVLRGLAKKAN